MQPIDKNVPERSAHGGQPSLVNQLQEVLNLKELPDSLSIVMYGSLSCDLVFVGLQEVSSFQKSKFRSIAKAHLICPLGNATSRSKERILSTEKCLVEATEVWSVLGFIKHQTCL